MNPHVETLLTALIVGTAAVVMLRRFVRFVRSADAGGGCGTSCGKCASNADSLRQGTLKPLVQLQITGKDGRDSK
jgi:bacterioferritin-associated ferredoxin